MKVSIIVPVYGVEDYIIKCMDSLVNQTLKDIEIIVVNDGTKDNSIKKIYEKYDDDRIKVIYKENGGQASARNRGVRYAKGEYLFFVDSDDFIDIHTLEEMYKIAKKGDYDIVFCDYYKYFDDTNIEQLSTNKFYSSNNLKSSVLALPGPVCKLIKKDLYFKYHIEYLEGYCFEDLAIIPFLQAVAKKYFYLEKPFYYYLQRDGSTINKSKYDSKWEDIFYVMEYLKTKFIDANIYLEYKEEIEYLYIEHLLHAANLRFIDYKEGSKNIKKVSRIMKQEFPKWRFNKYYKLENKKYHLYCNLFYYNQVGLLKILRKLRRNNNG